MKDLIKFEGTRFIFGTNFEGNPDKDKYKSAARKGNIVLTEEQAKDLLNAGFNVKVTKPRQDSEYSDEFEPTYYVTVIVKFGDKEALWPKVYLVSGDCEPVRLYADTIGMIDDIWVDKVDLICGQHEYDKGKFTLYVRTMYVTQNIEDDPFASKYNKPAGNIPAEEDIPF